MLVGPMPEPRVYEFGVGQVVGYDGFDLGHIFILFDG